MGATARRKRIEQKMYFITSPEFVSRVHFEIHGGFTPLGFTPITAARERGRVTPHSEKPSGNIVSPN
jgi:hypothetical protein